MARVYSTHSAARRASGPSPSLRSSSLMSSLSAHLLSMDGVPHICGAARNKKSIKQQVPQVTMHDVECGSSSSSLPTATKNTVTNTVMAGGACGCAVCASKHRAPHPLLPPVLLVSLLFLPPAIAKGNASLDVPTYSLPASFHIRDGAVVPDAAAMFHETCIVSRWHAQIPEAAIALAAQGRSFSPDISTRRAKLCTAYRSLRSTSTGPPSESIINQPTASCVNGNAFGEVVVFPCRQGGFVDATPNKYCQAQRFDQKRQRNAAEANGYKSVGACPRQFCCRSLRK